MPPSVPPGARLETIPQPTQFYTRCLNLFSKLDSLLTANVPLSTKCIYYIGSSVSGQDEPNPVL